LYPLFLKHGLLNLRGGDIFDPLKSWPQNIQPTAHKALFLFQIGGAALAHVNTPPHAAAIGMAHDDEMLDFKVLDCELDRGGGGGTAYRRGQRD
jgi:hypothetical protein